MWPVHSAASRGGKLGVLALTFAVSHMVSGGLVWADSDPAKADATAVGYQIFNREWMPNDARAHGGDGLGPVYNDTSCIACHNLGGSGGAGPTSKNVDPRASCRHAWGPGGGLGVEVFRAFAPGARPD